MRILRVQIFIHARDAAQAPPNHPCTAGLREGAGRGHAGICSIYGSVLCASDCKVQQKRIVSKCRKDPDLPGLMRHDLGFWDTTGKRKQETCFLIR